MAQVRGGPIFRSGPSLRQGRVRQLGGTLLGVLLLATAVGPASAQPPTPYSLNGTWEWVGSSGSVNLSSVVQNGTSVTARLRQAVSCGVDRNGVNIGWASNAVDFQGTITAGGIINGTVTICQFEDDSLTVPVATGTAPVVLSVSDDGLRLVGSWFNDVRLIDVPLSYTKKPSVTASTLLLVDDQTSASLKYLSVGAHAYFNGVTQIWGKLQVTRAAAASSNVQLRTMTLEVTKDGVVRATADLASAMRDTYLNRAFPSSGTLGSSVTSRMLFELAPAQSALLASITGSLKLRVKITTSEGEEYIKSVATAVKPLVRYTGANRYGGRDAAYGGDDWVQPSIKTILDHYTTKYGGSAKGKTGLVYGDMSNMNGGKFPAHQGHLDGSEADAWFTGYNTRGATVAAILVKLLNDMTYGSRITKVYVTYSEKLPCDAFCKAIKTVVLTDGRLARTVIRPAAGHDTHFHLIMTP